MKSSHYFEQVYEVTRSIPYGRVSTYGAIADYLALGSARMVGWALRNLTDMNGDVPAHRVVNRKGELTGRLHFSHPELMQKLLEREGVTVKNHTVAEFGKLFWHPGEMEDM